MCEEKELEQRIEQFLEWTPSNSADHLRALSLREDQHWRNDFKRKRLVFGTAGIRGPMGLGFGKMNDLVVVQTTQGLAHYLLEEHKKQPFKNLSVVVGHDGRHNSERWSKMISAVLKHLGIEVSRYREMTPTPWVAFGVRQEEAAAGVMVTASHNPKEDNGYKVYDSNGVQILPPVAEMIERSILNHLQPCSMRVFDANEYELQEKRDSRSKHLVENLTKAYIDKLKNNMFDLDMNKKCEMKLVYSAMHGVGARYVDRVFEALHLPQLIHVPEQREANPDFPTVKFPNPEEGASSLALSFALAEKNDCKYVLANDPDADRLAVAQHVHGEWKVFTGNEIGALLGWWLLHLAKTKLDDFEQKNFYFLASTVSSKLLEALAKSESNLHFEETLTGFKWMGSRALELEQMSCDNVVLLAFEEAIGFMCFSNVLDKDGVSAAARIAELIAFLHKQGGKTLNDQLLWLYRTYGYHCSIGRYISLAPGPELNAIFDRIRNWENVANTYPSEFALRKGDKDEMELQVVSVRDLTLGVDTSEPELKSRLPMTPDSQMITLRLSNGVVVTARNSGTEPKLKFYAEYCAQPDQTDWERLRRELEDVVEAIMDAFVPNRKK